MSKQCKLDIVDLFLYVFNLCKSTSTTKPELLMNHNLWNFVASGISAGVLSGNIHLFTLNLLDRTPSIFETGAHTGSDTDKTILNFEDLAMLASMHPKLNEMVNQGYSNARELNSGIFRLGYYFGYISICESYGWTFGGIPTSVGLESWLFVEIEFALSGIAFGSYTVGNCDPTKRQEHKHEVLPISFGENGQPAKDQFNSSWNSFSYCPYCGDRHSKNSKLFGYMYTNKKCGRR